jgi:lysylphosphatidylglycerol synthetase-like protein (DUF2156 family)
MKKSLWKILLRIALLVLLIYALYTASMPVFYIALVLIIIILLFILRGAFYRKIDSSLNSRLHFSKKLPPWLRKLLVIVLFIGVYMLIKQILFALLKSFGVDFPGMISESINNSINK